MEDGWSMKSEVSGGLWEVLFRHIIIKRDTTSITLLNYQKRLVIFFSLIMQTFFYCSDFTLYT